MILEVSQIRITPAIGIRRPSLKIWLVEQLTSTQIQFLSLVLVFLRLRLSVAAAVVAGGDCVVDDLLFCLVLQRRAGPM